jgi:hypothetical protein
MQVGASSPTGGQTLIGIAGRALGGGRVADDGTFQLRGLAGQQMIRVGNIPAGWTLKSITLGAEEITDGPYDFKTGHDLTGLTITLSDKSTTLSGVVKTSRGETVKDYVLVIFPDDAKLWGGQSRFVRIARPNQEGAYSLKGLPPARYLAAAVESLETGTQNDPTVLEGLRSTAKSFTLAEGQTLTLDVPMSASQ